MRGSRPHNPNADYIVIDDIWFYKETRGLYYLGNVPDETGKKHPVRAHVYVWEKHYGKIPDGFSVHHLDKNPRNNELSNLALMSYSAHSSHHGLEHSEQSRENMKKYVRPKAIEWHKSDAGSEWHKKHYEEHTKDQWNTLVTKKCEVCGKEFQVKSCASGHSKYCSLYCKRRSEAYKAGHDHRLEMHRQHLANHMETRTCEACGKPFSVTKYYKTKTCSPECRAEMIRRSKIELYSRLREGR